MKFIFPQNYNFKNKIFGVIDYSTAFINLIWFIFVFFIISIFCSNLIIKISITIIFVLPLILFSFAGFHGENIIYIISYLIKFYLKQKVFLYKK